MAVTRVLFASSLLPSPCLLATRAETAALIEKNMVRAINFGWVVRPTAATALGPIPDTMKVSIISAIEIKKNSKRAGQATPIDFFQ